jgi:hypothetical protein
MGTAEALGKVAATYRMKPDGSFEALESVHAGAAEQVTMFVTYEGIVVVIGPERPASAAGG